jgi:YHS domain-containing protein
MGRFYWIPSAVVSFLVLLLYVYTRSRLDVMPSNIAVEEERTLYLKPAGKYTQADILANGSMIASRKFSGFRAKHDFRPRPGDRLCPITRTKANPECTWVIGGQTYQFCCPPCVAEFVRLAKEEPDQVREPHAYIKR